ncbi:MAG: V-type ATP synthase subunit D [Deltaproteobacteria bacterium]
MAKLKKTKNELKAQREALQRYQRFLPTLELKKQQLQREVRRAEAELRRCEERANELLAGLRPWAGLLTGPPDLAEYVRVEGLEVDTVNVAGVNAPVLAGLRYVPAAIDYFATPVWLDDAVEVLGELTRLRAEMRVLVRQRDLLGEELRLTSQRVNLFEKVMIPSTLDNIRIIRIALGDAQTAAVARAKLAKSKTVSVLSGKSSA